METTAYLLIATLMGSNVQVETTFEFEDAKTCQTWIAEHSLKNASCVNASISETLVAQQ